MNQDDQVVPSSEDGSSPIAAACTDAASCAEALYAMPLPAASHVGRRHLLAPPPPPPLPPAAVLPSAHTRHVHFDLASTVEHKVIAYSEIYGMDPKEFEFDRRYNRVPVLRRRRTGLRIGNMASTASMSENEDQEQSDSSHDDCYDSPKHEGVITLSLFEMCISE